MSMTVAEARTEAKNLLQKADEIEKKYPDGLTEEINKADHDEVKRLLTEVDGLETKLATLESAEQRRQRIQDGLKSYGTPAQTMRHAAALDEVTRQIKSPGEQFVESAEFKRLLASGQFANRSTRVEFTVPLSDGSKMLDMIQERKSLVRGGSATSGGGFVNNDRLSGLINILQREISIFDLVPRYQTTSDTIEYVKEDTFTNNAAVVAEATATTGTTGLKPETDLAYSVATSPVKTIAHWVPVTNRMLADFPQIRGIIDNRLTLGLDLKLSSEMLVGAGTGEDFTGIINTTNVQVTGVPAAGVIDAIFKARTMVRVVGRARPNAVVLHPYDWEAIRLTRENAATATLGQYLIGPPTQSGAVTLWGLPVVEDEGITENTGLVGDFALGSGLFDREQAQIRVGYVDDQFIRNMQTLLAELRACFVVFRPTAFCKITGI